MTPLQSAACTYRIAFGPRAVQKVLSLQSLPSVDVQHTKQRCVNERFSPHAEVRCAMNQRKQLGLNLAKAEISAKWKPGNQAPPAELPLPCKGPEVVVTQCPQARLGIDLRGGKMEVPKKLLHLVNRHKPRIEQDRRDGMPQ
jgi:hypothetical protein